MLRFNLGHLDDDFVADAVQAYEAATGEQLGGGIPSAAALQHALQSDYVSRKSRNGTLVLKRILNTDPVMATFECTRYALTSRSKDRPESVKQARDKIAEFERLVAVALNAANERANTRASEAA